MDNAYVAEVELLILFNMIMIMYGKAAILTEKKKFTGFIRIAKTLLEKSNIFFI